VSEGGSECWLVRECAGLVRLAAWPRVRPLPLPFQVRSRALSSLSLFFRGSYSVGTVFLCLRLSERSVCTAGVLFFFFIVFQFCLFDVFNIQIH
jgi:hypothetical protein